MRRALRPLVIGSQAVPIPVIAPLLILVLGFGLAPKVLLVALVCFFPVTINLYDGLRRVDPDARKLLRSFDATRWQSFRLLEAPAALPAAFTGLKVAAAVSVIGAVFAEWAGSDAGLGHALLTANGQLETARAFAATFLLFVLAVALYGAVRAARAAGGEVAMRRLAIARRRSRCSRSSLAGCGEKDENAPGRRQDREVQRHPRLLPQRRPRRLLRRAGRGRLRARRARRRDQAAARPRPRR